MAAEDGNDDGDGDGDGDRDGDGDSELDGVCEAVCRGGTHASSITAPSAPTPVDAGAPPT